ncbi:hypothetical protein FIBSPDRAFT_958546 [Athelia psychrophila]|uniref:Uncharacterized protein n=1 Tax=Athelia psychrophila TaxID=1759441 RepID=A0A166EEY1_9AGAM|nr:hypothetical protein FIBSPDRAFT_958546 [Fibularhizoctonia sp. CBS 109695]
MINIAMTNRATAYAAKIPSVRGFILHINIAVLSFVIGKQGDVNVPRLTNNVLPKRAPRRTFDLSKADDARKYVAGFLHPAPAPLPLRRIEDQEEQKTEYDVVIAKRVSEKKAKVAPTNASHNAHTDWSIQLLGEIPRADPYNGRHHGRCQPGSARAPPAQPPAPASIVPQLAWDCLAGLFPPGSSNSQLLMDEPATAPHPRTAAGADSSVAVAKEIADSQF